MKKFFVCAVAVFIHAEIISAQSNSSLSLQQCIETAIKNNPDVKQSDFQSQIEHVNANQAKSNLLPFISAYGEHGIQQGRSIDPYTNGYINEQVNYATYGLNGSLLLFGGLGNLNSIQQTNLADEASKMELQEAKDNLTVNVIISYLQVLTAKDLLESATNQWETAKKQVDRLEELNIHGAIVPSQLYDLKGELGNDQLAMINTQNALDAAKVNLAQFMNLPYDKNLELQPLAAEDYSTIYSAAPDNIYAAALQHLGVAKAADLRMASAEKGVATARSAYYPSLSLNGGVNTNYSNVAQQNIFQGTEDVPNGDYVVINNEQVPVISPQQNFVSEKIPYSDQVNNNVNSFISLGLQIPILNGLQTRHCVEIAKINKEQAIVTADATKIRLRQEVEQSYFNMTSAFNRYKTLVDQVAAYSESFRETEVRFNTGAVNSVDYLVSKTNMDRANLSLIVARYDYVLRTKILDYYQGILK